MSTEEIFATGRVVERLAVCVFAGMSLTYGWNLFRVGVLTEQSAELSSKGWRVNLKRVGPGAFFAMFGSIVLAISLKSPLTLPIENHKDCCGQSADANRVQPQPVIYVEGTDDKVTKQWVASLNTTLNIATPEVFTNPTQKKIISRTNTDLEALRNTLVIRKFGAPLFREYKAYREQLRNGDVQGTPEVPAKFQQIDEWMQGNRILE